MTLKMRVHAHQLMGGEEKDRKISVQFQIEPGQLYTGAAFTVGMDKAAAASFPVGALVSVTLVVE